MSKEKAIFHRLEAYFQGSEKGYLRTTRIIDAVQDAISSLRGLSDLLCGESFLKASSDLQACSRILSSTLYDLDYVIEKWRRYEDRPLCPSKH